MGGQPAAARAMKIVLSRKGFDSGAGGCPNAVLADGRMAVFPIPQARSGLTLGEVKLPGGLRGQANASLADLLAALTRNKRTALAPSRLPIHLDPDLDPASRERKAGWRAAFGQTGAALTHLDRQKVGVGDLFLFFSWFRRIGADLTYQPGDFNAVYGWLQVGEMLDVDGVSELAGWLDDHPHVACRERYAGANRLYIAADELTLAGRSTGLAGAGTLRFDERLRLSAPGGARAPWRLPSWILPKAGPCLSYHADPTRWTRDAAGITLRSVARGQEFVLDTQKLDVGQDLVGEWIESMISGTPTSARQRP